MDRPTSTTPTTQSSIPTTAPTTFVQADTNNFRDVVQKLTGAVPGDASDKLPVMTNPARPAVGPRKAPFKLHDRRPSVRKLEIKLGYASLYSPRSPSASTLLTSPSGSSPYSPQIYHHPIPNNNGSSTSLPFPSPVTPLVIDKVFSPDVSEEERAIMERRFYLHPSPRTSTPRGSDPPELLPLFPLSSPKQSTSSLSPSHRQM